MYTQSTCTDITDGTTTDSGYGTVGSSSGDVSYPNGQGNGWGISVLGYLCPPTQWSKKGSSWTTQVNGLGALVINPLEKKIINIELYANCITIPAYNLTTDQAGVIFAQAFNGARVDLAAELQEGTVQPNSLDLRNEFIRLLKISLRKIKSSSSFSSGPCLGDVSQNKAQYGC
ncbi:hypothetical protein [Siphonobacter sp. SORGH_AS_1065]|uniref:hypothetical protein n=1 Tax=Siphonobacter sp. SORGH_AS_1065 TaxID=3041795 RepID=UPI002781CA27|nr:hypothetical protein [Siphonobacter sp. SORGH_AS_1065]MDQ1086404.1 hypothetical protein [Siphonobacter sp. SORGH_AS_1065]